MTPPVDRWTEGAVEHTSQHFGPLDILSDFLALFRRHSTRPGTADAVGPAPRLRIVEEETTTTTRRRIVEASAGEWWAS